MNWTYFQYNFRIEFSFSDHCDGSEVKRSETWELKIHAKPSGAIIGKTAQDIGHTQIWFLYYLEAKTSPYKGPFQLFLAQGRYNRVFPSQISNIEFQLWAIWAAQGSKGKSFNYANFEGCFFMFSWTIFLHCKGHPR